MTPEQQYEVLKKHYILQTEAHLKKLEAIDYESIKTQATKVELAVSQQSSSTSFMELCLFILKQSH